MAEAAEEVQVAEDGHWLSDIKGKDVSDPDDQAHTAKAIYNKMVKDLESNYKENDNSVKDLPIWFAVEVKKKEVEFIGYGNTLETLKELGSHRSVVVAWVVVRCHDVDQQLRIKTVKVFFKGQGLGVKGRVLFQKADAFVRSSDITAGVEENLFVDTEDWEYSGRSIDALCKQIKKNAGAHGAKKFYLGAGEVYKHEDE
jgi:hypothetical protein